MRGGAGEAGSGGAHLHGGEPEHDFARLGIRPRPVLDFSTSTSPLGPPAPVREAWAGLFEEVSSYPGSAQEGIRAYYETRYAVPAASVLGGNGSTELIYLVPRALGLKRIAVISPSYHDYERASRLAGAEVCRVELSAADDFAPLAFERLKDALRQADALFLGSPSNPTGTVFPPDTLLRLAREFPGKWVLVDEAFNQFLDRHRELTLIRPDRLLPNILVFQSLTKFYALPGLRLGALIGHPDAVARLRSAKEPWTLNRIADRAAGILATCGDYDRELRRLVASERERLGGKMAPLDGVRTFPATANFFLARWTATGDLDDLLRELLGKGLYARDCRNFPGLEDNFFRFAVRQPDENDRLLSAIAGCAGGSDV